MNKNRVIRISDDLWTNVGKEASRRGQTKAEFIREELSKAASTPLCFHCGKPATYEFFLEYWKPDAEWIDKVMGKVAPAGTPVTLEIYTCDMHRQDVANYFLDLYGASNSYDLIDRDQPRCEHPFHTGRHPGIPFTVSEEIEGRGCPNPGCSPTVSLSDGSERDQPAYLELKKIVESIPVPK